MPVATARTISLQGATGHLIDVQVDVTQGLVTTALVGRPDASINEARDRCRAALDNSGFDWPTTRRVTILLSPADLPKRGPHFDLAIAVGVLAASGAVPKEALPGVVFVGELTLEGRLRSVRWGPRTLDVDVIVVDQIVTADPRLTLPHPRAHERAFVLVPWLGLDREAAIPGRGSVRGLLAKVDRQDVVRIGDPLPVPR